MLEANRSRYRWYVLSMVILVIMLVHAASSSCITVLFSEISADLGLNLVEVGAIWGGVSLGGIFIMLFAGMLGDRFGSKRVVTIACTSAVIFGSLRGLATDFTTLAVATVLFGISIETLPVNLVKMVSQWFYGRQFGMAQGGVTMGVGTGFMLGTMLSATVLSPALGGWRNVIFLSGLVSLSITLLWALTIREPHHKTDSLPTATHGFRESLAHITKVRTIWLVGLAMFGFSGCYQSILGYLPLYLRENGWAAVSADGAVTLFNAASMVCAVPILMISDRVGRRKIFYMSGAIVGIVGSLLLSSFTGPEVWFLVIMTGFVRDACYAISATMCIEAAGVGPEYAGTAGGIACMISRIGITIGPPLGNSLATAAAPGRPFLLWAGMSFMALVALLLIKEKKKERL